MSGVLQAEKETGIKEAPRFGLKLSYLLYGPTLRQPLDPETDGWNFDDAKTRLEQVTWSFEFFTFLLVEGFFFKLISSLVFSTASYAYIKRTNSLCRDLTFFKKQSMLGGFKSAPIHQIPRNPSH